MTRTDKLLSVIHDARAVLEAPDDPVREYGFTDKSQVISHLLKVLDQAKHILMEVDDAEPGKPSGVSLIAAERQRQVSVERWTPEHDDGHVCNEMAFAARCYIDAAVVNTCWKSKHPAMWPWKFIWWKPSPDPIRNLVKAGALVAAEIDRLQRARERDKS